MVLRKAIVSIGCAMACFNGSAHAFEAYGLRSGMTRAEVQAAAPTGFTYRDTGNLRNAGAITSGEGPSETIFVTVAFCAGRLVAVTRMIDPDTDWLPKVQAALAQRGQPAAEVTGGSWLGPGGGDINHLDLAWWNGNERYDLELTPEGRGAGGALRFYRSASESYFVKQPGPC